MCFLVFRHRNCCIHFSTLRQLESTLKNKIVCWNAVWYISFFFFFFFLQTKLTPLSHLAGPEISPPPPPPLCGTLKFSMLTRPATGVCLATEEFIPHLFQFFKIPCDIILSSTPRSTKWCHHSWVSSQNFVCNSNTSCLLASPPKSYDRSKNALKNTNNGELNCRVFLIFMLLAPYFEMFPPSTPFVIILGTFSSCNYGGKVSNPSENHVWNNERVNLR